MCVALALLQFVNIVLLHSRSQCTDCYVNHCSVSVCSYLEGYKHIYRVCELKYFD